MLSLALIVAMTPSADPAAFIADLNRAAANKDASAINTTIAKQADATALAEMVKSNGGWTKIHIDAAPAPRSWSPAGSLWVVFSANQELEMTHDFVFEARIVDGAWKLVREVREDAPQGTRVAKAKIFANLMNCAKNQIRTDSTLTLEPLKERRDLVFRLNSFFRIGSLNVGGKNLAIQRVNGYLASAQPGAAVQVGGIVIVPTPKETRTIRFAINGTLQQKSGDTIEADKTYLTSYWLPCIGRLPHPTETLIDAPTPLTVFSEGEGGAESADPVKGQRWHFRCDVPISWPKIVAGRYTMVAQGSELGVKLYSYQLEPTDAQRGQADVERMKLAIRSLSRFGKFPFSSYSAVDSDTFYGIESYSYTLLQRKFTTKFVTHEMGHTYFGGLAPCTYIRDSFNESLTQYVDSILLDNNSDHSLQQGLASIRFPVALDTLSAPWSYGNASYTRGAYVMNMLRQEIGLDATVAALREIATLHGQDLDWNRIQPIFERHAERKLNWFWEQWVRGTVFPTLEMAEQEPEGTTRVFRLQQSGTPRPYRMVVQIVIGDVKKRFLLTQSDSALRWPGAPAGAAKLDVFDTTLARVKG